MSDQVLIILIPSLFGFLTAVLSLISLIVSRRSVTLSESNARSIVEVVKNTDGMRTELTDALKGKGVAEVFAAGAEGKLSGIAEGRRQGKEDAAAAAFVPATTGAAAPTPSVAAAADPSGSAIDTAGLKIVVEKQDLAGDISEKGPKA